MIISHVIGGLGNQMFQYAAGRALALERREVLWLDVSGYDGYGLHQGFELGRVFGCQAPLASRDEVRAVLGWRGGASIRNIVSKPQLSFVRGKSFVVEPHFNYWPDIRTVPASVYLQGYWQSEKYFADARDIIRADFTFRKPVSKHNAAWMGRIVNCSSVSMHIRRGDYVSDARTYAAHGVCPIEYYRSAVDYIAKRVEQPEFFVFSDDIAWARENLNTGYACHYIDHNRGEESYNDMRLMSLCRHHIIANSSFSWWGAWLNPSADKIVVAPKRWFASGDRRLDDLLPPSWVTL